MKLFSIALLNFKSAMNQTHIPDKGLEDSSLENNLTGIKKKTFATGIWKNPLVKLTDFYPNTLW